MGVFKVKKNFGRKMSSTFCGSPLIGMNPQSRPSLRTQLMILVPDCAITKPKLFLIPEAEHCGLNYYGFLSMTVTGPKVYLVSDCSVKNPNPVRWHISDSPYMGVPPPPPLLELFQEVISTYHWPAAVPCWETKLYNSDQLKIPAFKIPHFKDSRF